MPTQTAYIQVNRDSMPGYIAPSGFEPYYSEARDPPNPQGAVQGNVPLRKYDVHYCHLHHCVLSEVHGS
jgi:hypothetical protein